MRRLTLVFTLASGLAIALGVVISVAQAAPLGKLTQFKVPTADSGPRHITLGSDRNLWFTEGNEIFIPNPDPETGGISQRSIGKITPAGEITEFPIESRDPESPLPNQCDCLLNDIVQGPNGVLYFTTNDPGLGRITTSGDVLAFVSPANTGANGGGIATRGDAVWYTDFNNDSLWRYDVPSGQFMQFPITPGSDPVDVAVDDAGTVWFSGGGAIGRLDPQSGAFTETPIPDSSPRFIAIASDGKVWFTDQFNHRVGYLDPSTNEVKQFGTLTPNAGPVGIVADSDGSVWFTQTLAGNVARATPSGVIAEGKSVKNSQPFGITIGPGGNPWYTMTSANKIARLTLN